MIYFTNWCINQKTGEIKLDWNSILLLILYLSMATIGYAIGTHYKKKGKASKSLSKIQTVAIILLVFAMGCRIGMNKDIIKSLDTIGITAFVFTILVMSGSVLSVLVVRKLMGINKKGLKDND